MNCVPTEIAADGPLLAPTDVPPTAELPIAPVCAAGLPIAPATIPLPALAKTNEPHLEEGSGFDKSDWGDDDEEEGFAAGTVKSHKCFGVKCASICACNAIRSFSLATPVLSMSNPVRTAV